MLFHYAIIENVNHTVCLEIRFSDSAAYQTQNPVGFCFSKWISRNCLGRKKGKKTKQTRTIWGDNRLNISRLWNLSNLWNQRNLRNRYDEKKRNNNEYENTLTLFEILISGIKKITLLVLFCCFLFDYIYFLLFSLFFICLPWRPTTGHPSSHREHRRICKYVLVNNGLVTYKDSHVNKQSCSQHLKIWTSFE